LKKQTVISQLRVMKARAVVFATALVPITTFRDLERRGGRIGTLGLTVNFELGKHADLDGVSSKKEREPLRFPLPL
jgi:hypothetical protein